MKIFKRILVPIDFSECSLASLEYAEVLSQKYDGTIYLLHVVDPTLASTMSCECIQAALEEARRKLRILVYWKLSHSGNIEQIVIDGMPDSEIVRYAEEQQIDLIVMAASGQGGRTPPGMGSVAKEVRRLSTVPVLNVEPDQSCSEVVRRSLWAGRAESSPDVTVLTNEFGNNLIPADLSDCFVNEEDLKEQLHIP